VQLPSGSTDFRTTVVKPYLQAEPESGDEEDEEEPADKTFAEAEESELHKANFLAKDREQLTSSTPVKFNGGQIELQDNSILLTQERQCQNLRLVALKAINLTSSRGEVRQAVTPKDQCVAQRARGAYIATVCQPKAAFDLSFAAQVVNPKEENAKQLNKRLQ
jgi:hypothetical protein